MENISHQHGHLGDGQRVATAFLKWIREAVAFISDAGFGASAFFKDVTKAQNVMADALAKYAKNRGEALPGGEETKFSLIRTPEKLADRSTIARTSSPSGVTSGLRMTITAET